MRHSLNVELGQAIFSYYYCEFTQLITLKLVPGNKLPMEAKITIIFFGGEGSKVCTNDFLGEPSPQENQETTLHHPLILEL